MRFVSTVRWISVGTLLVLLVLPAAVSAFVGVKFVTVDGRSMTPTYAYGDVVLIGAPTRADFKPGHVITVRQPGGSLYTHRIQSVTDGRAQLKGDGNKVPDPTTISLNDVVGAVRGHIGQPLSGLISYTQQWPARISLAILTTALILLPLGHSSSMRTQANLNAREERADSEENSDDHSALLAGFDDMASPEPTATRRENVRRVE